MPLKNLGDFLALLRGVKPMSGGRYTALCPGHEDKRASLSIAIDSDKILIKCHAGCDTQKIVQSLNLTEADLFLHRDKPPAPKRQVDETRPASTPGVIEKTYPYTDADGKLLYEVVRYKPKNFKQRRPDGSGGYIWDLKGVTPVLYHLPEVIKAVKDTRLVFLCAESEKDVESLRSWGLVSTTNSGGAGKFHAEFTEYLKGAQIVVLAHNDPPGLKAAATICGMLKDKAKSLRLFIPPAGKDVTEWIERGGTKEQLQEIVMKLPEWKPEPNALVDNSKYIIETDKGPKLDFEKLTADLLNEYHFLTFVETEEVLIYQDGVYRLRGEAFVKAECQRRVGIIKLVSEYVIREIIGHIRRSTYMRRDAFNTNTRVINLKNGLLSLDTKKIAPHSHEFLSTTQIPISFDPGVECLLIKKFLSEVLSPSDIPIIQEFIGYCLISEYKIQKAILLQGDGDNGKSTLLNLLKTFIGPSNVSHISWQDLENDKFSKSNLEGKLVNIFADLPSQKITSTTAFKTLTGGDAITGEKKFKEKYSFNNFAKLIFSTNKPPEVMGEDSFAFWRRWVIVDFPNQIPESKKDLNLIKKLTSETELTGLLNYAIDGLERIFAQNKYSYNKSIEDISDAYERSSNPIYAFVVDECDIDPEGVIDKNVLYDRYRQYCKEHKLPILKPNSFFRSIKNQKSIDHIEATRPKNETTGERYNAIKGLTLKDTAKKLEDKKKERIVSVSKRLGMPFETALELWERNNKPIFETDNNKIEDLHDLIEKDITDSEYNTVIDWLRECEAQN